MTAGLEKSGSGLRHNVEMKPFTWFRCGGPAQSLFLARNEDDLKDQIRVWPREKPILPVGVASNLLIRDGGYPGLVVRFGGSLSAVHIEGKQLTAGAGALDQKVAQVAQKAGLTGLEFMIGIPGSIGGAVKMNAGAFGGETKDRFIWAECMDRDGSVTRLSRSELGFSYRRSQVGDDLIVLRACFDLEEGDPDEILRSMGEIRAERERSQPLKVATGGSTFKNPPGHRAWQLIDAAGCRGLEHGNAAVSEKHCNFLINKGGARAQEIEELGEIVRDRVLAHSGVSLEWEIKRVGLAR